MKSGFAHALIATLALLAGCIHSSASTLIESWEGSGVNGLGGNKGRWEVSDKVKQGISLSYSGKHATNGRYAIKIDTQGGWSQVLLYTENSTNLHRNPMLHELLSGKLTLNLDVYTAEKLAWSKVEIAIQGNALPWTQLGTNSLLPGPTSVKYLIPPKVSAAMKNCDEWFQIIIIVNTSGAGTVYIDNLSCE
jgi:hypothetical protein